MDIAPIKAPPAPSKVSLEDLTAFLQMVTPEDIISCLYTRIGSDIKPLADTVQTLVTRCQEREEFRDMMLALIRSTAEKALVSGAGSSIIATFLAGLAVGIHVALTTTATTSNKATIN